LEKIERFLQNAAFSATMLGNLINDMLDLAKFESGTFKFHNEYFDLIEIIEQAFETIKYHADKKEITMRYRVLDSRNEPQKKN
jgi:signal transduction histidine kinase